MITDADVDDEWEEFGFHCGHCDLMEAWSTAKAAQAAGNWHLFEQHPRNYRVSYGDARPGLRPAQFGKRLGPGPS